MNFIDAETRQKVVPNSRFKNLITIRSEVWGREGRPGALEPTGCLIWASQTSSAGHGTTFSVSPFLAGSKQHGLCSKGRLCALLWHQARQGSGGVLHTGSHPHTLGIACSAIYRPNRVLSVNRAQKQLLGALHENGFVSPSNRAG